MLTKQKHLGLKDFFFPIGGFKIFSSVKFITVLAILIALRIVLGVIGVPIAITTQKISFAWIPLMIMGWFFGPIFGFIFGAFTDTLTWLIFPGSVWFWMFAIQEPLVATISGIFSGIYRIRVKSEERSTNIIFDTIFQQIILFSFSIVGFICLTMWLTPDVLTSADKNFILFFKILTIFFLSIFVIVNEWITIYLFKNNKKKTKKKLLFIYASSLVSVNILIFSFVMGPISTYSYYVYINGHAPTSQSFIKYGFLIYLIPRIVVQSIKVPIECMLFMSLVYALNPTFERLKNHLTYSNF